MSASSGWDGEVPRIRGLWSRWTWGRRAAGFRCCGGWREAGDALVQRFANAPRETAAGLRWDLAMIVAGSG